MDEDWITADELRAALDAEVEPISVHQTERWRREGLLPRPRQIGHGRGGGSHTIVRRASIAQAREIARLYSIREKRDWVGWQLWLRGFTVAERFWREPLEEAANSFKQVRKAGETIARKMEMDGESISVNAQMAICGSAIGAGITKLPSEMIETVIGYGLEIASGSFDGISCGSDGKPNRRDLAAIIETIGASPAKRHQIEGTSLDFAGQIETSLKEIAKAILRLTRHHEIAEPSIEARSEFIMGLELGIELHRMFKPKFGRNALGLGVFSRIAANPAIHIQAAMLIVWAEYRELSKAKLPFSEIEALYLSAIQLGAKTGN